MKRSVVLSIGFILLSVAQFTHTCVLEIYNDTTKAIKIMPSSGKSSAKPRFGTVRSQGEFIIQPGQKKIFGSKHAMAKFDLYVSRDGKFEFYTAVQQVACSATKDNVHLKASNLVRRTVAPDKINMFEFSTIPGNPRMGNSMSAFRLKDNVATPACPGSACSVS